MRNHADIWIAMTGLYLVLTSVCVVVGRMAGVRWLYDWGDSVGMAYTTAVNFAVVGVALWVIGMRFKKESK